MDKQPALSIDQILAIPFPSYHKPLEMARALARSGEPSDREEAAEFLERLAGRYPHALAIGQELVFVLMELQRYDRAEQALRGFEKKFSTLDEEFLCRWGRLFKERGDAHSPAPRSDGEDREDGDDPTLAERYYRKSLEKYDQAYRIREGHYPGINKATLLLILGTLRARMTDAPAPVELASSAELAGKILASRGAWHPERPDDEEVWFPATEGEAHLLLQEWAQAASCYREALRRKEQATAHSRESMRRQVGRILLCFKHLGIAPARPFDDVASFFGADRPSTGPVAPRAEGDPSDIPPSTPEPRS